MHVGDVLISLVLGSEDGHVPTFWLLLYAVCRQLTKQSLSALVAPPLGPYTPLPVWGLKYGLPFLHGI